MCVVAVDGGEAEVVRAYCTDDCRGRSKKSKKKAAKGPPKADL